MSLDTTYADRQESVPPSERIENGTLTTEIDSQHVSKEPESQVRRRVSDSKALHAAFGEIVNLLMRTPEFKHLPLLTLEGLVLPSLISGQFAILEGQEMGQSIVAPMAVILWASVSEDVDQKLSGNSNSPTKLTAKDWKSGDVPWIILAVGDERFVTKLKSHVEKRVLNGRQFKYRPLENKAPKVYLAEGNRFDAT